MANFYAYTAKTTLAGLRDLTIKVGFTSEETELYFKKKVPRSQYTVAPFIQHETLFVLVSLTKHMCLLKFNYYSTKTQPSKIFGISENDHSKLLGCRKQLNDFKNKVDAYFSKILFTNRFVIPKNFIKNVAQYPIGCLDQKGELLNEVKNYSKQLIKF